MFGIDTKSIVPSRMHGSSMRWMRAAYQDIALRLLEPTLTHATREHLAAMLFAQAEVLAADSHIERSSPPGRCRVTAELIHELSSCGERWQQETGGVVRIGGAYPLPWSFRDDEGVVQTALHLLFEDALRSVSAGFITVSIGFDVVASTLLASIVDSRSATRGRRRCAVLGRAGRLSHPTGCSTPLTPTSVIVLRSMRQRLLDGGGRLELGVSALGYSFTNVAIPIETVGPLLHGDDDVGRAAKNPVPKPRPRAHGRVLLIDRSVSTIRSLGVILRAHGIDSVSAPHGSLGVEVLRALPCDGVWIDIEDSIVVHGDVRERLRGTGFSGEVVGLSAHPRSSCGGAVAATQFEAVLTKPISCTAVRRYIERRSARRSGSLRCGGDELAPMSHRDAADIRGVIAEYRANLPGLLTQLDRALSERQFDVAERIAHTLKAGALFGVGEVSTAARTLEAALRCRDAGAIRGARDTLAEVVAGLAVLSTPSRQSTRDA